MSMFPTFPVLGKSPGLFHMISGLTTEFTNHEGLVTEWYRTVMGLGPSVI